MKMTQIFSAFAVILMMAMMSCASTESLSKRQPHWVPFTRAILNNPDYKLTEQKLHDSCQFALGAVGAIFERKVNEKMTKFENGKMIPTYVEKIYRDTLKAFTPCVMLSIDTADGLMRQNFGDSLHLIFGPDETGNYVLYGNGGRNEVSYRGFTWEIVSGGNNTATLNVDLETDKQNKKIGKILPGVTIAGNSSKKKK